MMTLLTMHDAAAILNVPLQRAYELARTGTLPVVRIGRQIRVDPERLQDFIGRGGRPLAVAENANGGEETRTVTKRRRPARRR